MRIVYLDTDIVVAIKPPRVLSTDEPGGMPELVRNALGNSNADIRTVHRLDAVVSGLMVLTRNAAAASQLSGQIRDGKFGKEYLAVVHGTPEEYEGTLCDLLLRNKQERKTYVIDIPQKGAQEAILHYRVLNVVDRMSRVQIELVTGRTHQIRAQFSSRGLPLVGDKKYMVDAMECDIALWSHKLSFYHPGTGQLMQFCESPPKIFPWTIC